jgi:CheY-like chemotaxis protein
MRTSASRKSPPAEAGRVASSRPPASPSPRFARRHRFPHDLRILVVEDDGASRKLITLLLNAEGVHVTGVGSAEEALVEIAVAPPDLLVLDLVLPRMGGLALVEHLKQHPATRGIIVVAVTSMSGPEVEGMALRAGCAGYLQKPIDIDELSRLLLRCIDGAR